MLSRTTRSSSLLGLFFCTVGLAAACGSQSSQDGTFGADGADAGLGDEVGAFGGFQNGGDGGPNGDSSATPRTCDPTCVAAGGTCTSAVCTLVENPGSVDAATQAKLTTGGTADSAFKWLYPYDKTVFAHGLLSPTMQFGGAAADAMLVHISFAGMDYQGFFGASSPLRVKLPEASWKAVTLAALGSDAVKVDVTKISGGAVTGPTTETWTIAQGTLRGTIYYETYGSQMIVAASGDSSGVGIMKIQPAATQPTIVKQGCGNVCHTASADGSTLVANQDYWTGITSASYDLKASAATIKKLSTGTMAQNQVFTYGGLYPDGSFLMSAAQYRTWLGEASKLYDSKTGALIAAPGWDGVLTNAGTPAFSPDGKQFAFSHVDKDSGHSLAVMAFNAGTHTFSGLSDVAHDASAYLGWPAFTPDGKSVVYQAGSHAQYETDANATGDLFAVDVASKTVRRLDALDGYNPGGGTASYLPANDPKLSFAPTVLPEAVGGYFWVVFTSHRSYGNTLVSKVNNDQDGKLWVAAVDLSPTAGTDPSHPAFYLEGQEVAADNLRGFWVLDPCKANGNGCTSGDDCCGGYCRPVNGTLQCTDVASGCSNEFEKCTTAGDCCNAGSECINGRCAQPAPH